MKVTTNIALARQRRRQAFVLSMAGVAVLAGGLVLNFRAAGGSGDGQRALLLAYLALIVGSMLSWAGVVLSDRWASTPRPDEALAAGLKGASPAYRLYNWALPAGHVLLAPWGLVVFTVFNHEGPIAIKGRKWRDGRPLYRRVMGLGRRAVRDPSGVLGLETSGLARALLEQDPDLADLAVEGVAFFSHSAVRVEAEDPSVPVVTAHTIRDWLRAEAKRPSLAATDRRRLERALEALAEARMSGTGAKGS